MDLAPCEDGRDSGFSFPVLADCQFFRTNDRKKRRLAHQPADQVADEAASERPGEVGSDRAEA
jgi:hypothetical protein